jgi:archaellum component FlaC
MTEEQKELLEDFEKDLLKRENRVESCKHLLEYAEQELAEWKQRIERLKLRFCGDSK